MDWFRMYHGVSTDPKWLSVARRAVTHCDARDASVRIADVVAVWCMLLDFASQCAPRGSVRGFDAESAADFLGLSESVVRAILQALDEKGILSGDRITNWEKRQPKREDSSAERMRRHRERKRRDVTLGDAGQANVTPRGEERRGDERDTPPPPPRARACEEAPVPDADADQPTAEPSPARGLEAFLGEPQVQARLTWWEREIAGWREGLNMPNGRPATDADIDTGLNDYLAKPGRDFSPVHVRRFVGRALLERLRPARDAPPNTRRGTAAERTFENGLRAFGLVREGR
jgi:hypothetical protein